jgi:hypothetical protein
MQNQLKPLPVFKAIQFYRLNSVKQPFAMHTVESMVYILGHAGQRPSYSDPPPGQEYIGTLKNL